MLQLATTKASVRYKDATLETEERQIYLTETSPEIQTQSVFLVLLTMHFALRFLYFIYFTVDSNIAAAYIPV